MPNVPAASTLVATVSESRVDHAGRFIFDDVQGIIDGTYVAPPTGLLYREDNLGLFYPRRIHQAFGDDGALNRSRAAIAQLDAALGDARETLKKVDAVLQQAQAVASNVRVATTDLGALRAEVEVSLRKVEYLVDEVNRKWPFARDTELKLP